MDKEFLEGLGMDPQAVEAVLQEHEKTVQAHQAQLAALQLQHQVSEAVHKAGGRSVKAISALLDMDGIAQSQNVETALTEALEALKKDSGYLFEEETTPPPYAPGTGTTVFGTPGTGDFNFGFTGVRAKTEK